jgi:hypothetical protein
MTNQQNPAWMSDTWVVNQVASGVSTVVMTDSVAFLPSPNLSSPNLIMRTSNSSSTPSIWGTWDTVTSNGLSGHISDGTPFQIVYNGVNQITCYLDPPQHRPWIWIVVSAVLGGTLAGAAAGRLAGNPAVGALAGLVGAATGSAVFAAAGPSSGGIQGTGPNATWVANDGGPVGVPKPSPQEPPQPLKVVSA